MTAVLPYMYKRTLVNAWAVAWELLLTAFMVNRRVRLLWFS